MNRKLALTAASADRDRAAGRGPRTEPFAASVTAQPVHGGGDPRPGDHRPRAPAGPRRRPGRQPVHRRPRAQHPGHLVDRPADPLLGHARAPARASSTSATGSRPSPWAPTGWSTCSRAATIASRCSSPTARSCASSAASAASPASSSTRSDVAVDAVGQRLRHRRLRQQSLTKFDPTGAPALDHRRQRRDRPGPDRPLPPEFVRQPGPAVAHQRR